MTLPAKLYELDQYFMRQALAQAELALQAEEIPVGAVVVDAHDQIIGQGYNRVISDHDPSAHAEMMALRAAARTVGNYRLNGCRLYVTLEPCTMCLGAIVHSRLARLIFGAIDPKTGACGGFLSLASDQRLNHHCSITSGVCAEQCGSMLKAFFRQKRGFNKS